MFSLASGRGAQSGFGPGRSASVSPFGSRRRSSVAFHSLRRRRAASRSSELIRPDSEPPGRSSAAAFACSGNWGTPVVRPVGGPKSPGGDGTTGIQIRRAAWKRSSTDRQL